MIHEAKQEVTYFLNFPDAPITIPTTPRITMPSATGIHSGLVTHHHDQSIVFVNLRIRNTINNVVPTPIPFDVLLSAMLFICYLVHNLKYLVWCTPSFNGIMLT